MPVKSHLSYAIALTLDFLNLLRKFINCFHGRLAFAWPFQYHKSAKFSLSPCSNSTFEILLMPFIGYLAACEGISFSSTCDAWYPEVKVQGCIRNMNVLDTSSYGDRPICQI